MRRPRPLALICTSLATAAIAFFVGQRLLPSDGVSLFPNLEPRSALDREIASFPTRTRPAPPRPRADSGLFATPVSESELEEALEKGDPCAALLWSVQVGDQKPGPVLSKLGEFLKAANVPDPHIEKLGAALSTESAFTFAQEATRAESNTVRFLGALAASGQVDLVIGQSAED
jgi:hypothetical protein